MSHEIYIKFSVDDTQRFYDWLHDGINKHAAGYDAFYTLVKDGVASRDFDPHLDIEAREAIAIAEVLRSVSEDTFNSSATTELQSKENIERISAALSSIYSE